MCGIVGVARVTPVEDAFPLARMRDAMAHRGPDAEGLWWSADRCVGFGHRRLSILDLSRAGDQPMLDAAGDLCITFNGEIYNFLELRAELEQLGHAFRSRTDTEVILAAFRQWGAAMLPRLNGMFAFAIHDRRDQSLFLARDRAGEKPLFVRRTPDGLTFASELKALLEDPSMERRVDRTAFELYLAYGYVPGSLCIFEGVEKLEQGHAARFDLRTGDYRRWAWWTLPPSPADSNASEEELAERVEALLEDAVRHQLIADVPVGILLSGGLDSSLVTAMAARSGSRVRTFTISFPGHGSFDEAKHARLVADHFGTEHLELAAQPSSVSLLDRLVRQYDEPLADSSIIPTFLVSSFIREHATVALGGDGGDELFGGYPHYSRLLWQQSVRRKVPDVVARAGHAAARALPAGIRGRNFLLGLTGDPASLLGYGNVYFDAATRRTILPRGWEPSVSPRGANANGDLVDLATRLDFTTYLVDDILVKVDRASMLTSLEVRAPFLDHRLIEFAFGAVPARMKATSTERKKLLRILARRILPAGFDVTRKQGFSIPLHDWFAGQWGRRMSEVLRDPDCVFRREGVEKLLAGQNKGRSNSARLFALTVFELWRREYHAVLA